MTQSADTAAQTTRFAEAVRAFTPVCTNRYAKLLPFKDGIVELRQKGGSYRLIRELLGIIGVSVTADTIGRFVREVIEQRPPVRLNRRRHAVRPLSEPSGSSALPTPSKPQFPFTVAPPATPANSEPEPSRPPQTPVNAQSTERPRIRGPRIADPANL
jgi:hypothetical protein